MASNNDLYQTVVRQVNWLTSERDAMREQIEALVEERNALRALLEMERDAPRVLKSILVTDSESGAVDSLKADLDDMQERLEEVVDKCTRYERVLVEIRDRFSTRTSYQGEADYNAGCVYMLCSQVLKDV